LEFAGLWIEIPGYKIGHAYGILFSAVGTTNFVAREFIPWIIVSGLLIRFLSEN
jgi:hypothetical protein